MTLVIPFSLLLIALVYAGFKGIRLPVEVRKLVNLAGILLAVAIGFLTAANFTSHDAFIGDAQFITVAGTAVLVAWICGVAGLVFLFLAALNYGSPSSENAGKPATKP